MQIIVLGVHRSGTSLVTRLINMMGAYFAAGGASIGFSDENPKGFWERRDVIEANDAILTYSKSSWEELSNFSLPTVDGKKQKKLPPEINDKIKNIILEMDGNRPWVMKDPRMCLTFPYWRKNLEVPVAVVVHRDALEVAQSLKTRNRFSLNHGLAIWEYYTAAIINSTQGMPVIHLSHNEILKDPVGLVKKLHDKLIEHGVQGLRIPSDKEILSFIEPSLYRSKLDDLDRSQFLTSYQQKLSDIVSGKTEHDGSFLEPSRLAQETMEHYHILCEKDTRSEEVNRKFATADQQCNELSRQVQTLSEHHESMQKIVQTFDDEKAVLVREIQTYRNHLENAYNSLRWRVGDKVANVVRILTFGKF